jgi:threonylcarbamoyladenosine tRNA methylthiotransferase MtaB
VSEPGAAASSPSPATVAVRTLGCKVNRAESERVAAELLGRGVQVVAEDVASVILINTCTVTGEADAKARKAVRRALGSPSNPVVVVTGCLAAVDAQSLAELGERVVVEADKELVAAAVAKALGIGSDAPLADSAQAAERVGDTFRTRVALKIQDGCDAFCAYCIVPYARGVPRSVGLADLTREAEALLAAGVREIVLTGVNVGRYRDADAGATLADVVRAVAATGVARIRLSSIEPLDLTPELLGVMAATPAFCAHLHVPLQAGSDEVLSAMGRSYTTADFTSRIEAARSALPGVVLTTDVMAGFPGESASQASETLAFCDSVGFSKLHVFRYSPRSGTPAAARLDQVAPAEKNSRAASLRELSARLEQRHALMRIGRDAEVLVERVVCEASGASYAEGTTREYDRVRCEWDAERPGDLIMVRLGAVEGDHVLGERL